MNGWAAEAVTRGEVLAVAELEAEEAANVPVITLTGEGWTKVNMQWDGVQRPCWIQLGSIEAKTAGEFEGEY